MQHLPTTELMNQEPLAESARLERYESRSRMPMIVLSLVFVVILVIESRVRSGSAFTALLILDLTIWAVFVADYAYRLKLAERRLAYALQPLNLIDLVVVVLPLFVLLGATSLLGLARVGRLLRLFGLLRAGGLLASNIKRVVIYMTRPSNARIALSLALLLSVVAAIGVFVTERRTAGGSFDGWLDTLWWGLSTVTTVGYGDIAPQSTAGRLLAMVVMLAGIAAFGWLMALLTSRFVEARQDEEDSALRGELAEISARLARLEQLLKGEASTAGESAVDVGVVEDLVNADEPGLGSPDRAAASLRDDDRLG